MSISGSRACTVAAVVMLCACREDRAPRAQGAIRFTVTAMASGPTLTRVVAEVQPADVTSDLAYDATAGAFAGEVVVPAGSQTVTVRAYSGTAMVGSGSAQVSVVAGATSHVFIRVLELTTPPGPPDHGPIITSVVFPATSVRVGESMTLAGSAVDPDGDPLSFLWTQTCAHGAFGTPDQATTTWTSSGGEVCVLAFNVESRGLVDRVEYRVTSLAAGSGVVQVDGVFVASPRISSASVGRCTILRAGADASCRGTYYPGQPVTVRVVHDGGEGATASLSDDCGGTVEGPTAAPTEAVYAWRAPAASALCRLRARIARDEMTDELAIALYVAACVDDTFEPNDRPEQAVPVSGTVAARLYANDDDWFSVSSATGVLRVIVQSRDAIATELYEGGAFVAGGVNGLRATVTPSNPYLLHLLPGTLAPSCASQYELSVAACAPGPETLCENAMDDDCDGLPDLFDPDCPGPVCWDGCPQGQICNEYGACVAHCADGYMSGDEGGVDCGGACPFKCPLGSHCWITPDCLPGLNCVGDVCSVP